MHKRSELEPAYYYVLTSETLACPSLVRDGITAHIVLQIAKQIMTLLRRSSPGSSER